MIRFAEASNSRQPQDHHFALFKSNFSVPVAAPCGRRKLAVSDYNGAYATMAIVNRQSSIVNWQGLCKCQPVSDW